MVIEPRYFNNQLVDALIPAEDNINKSDKASACLRCGVKEPIMLDIVITQSTGESLRYLERVWQTTITGRMPNVS